MPDVSLSGIEFTIKGSSDSAFDSVQKLIKELNELKSALKNTEGITGLSNALKKLTNVNSEKLVSVYSILANISLLDFSNIQQAADGIREIASAAREIANFGKGTKENPVEQITEQGAPQVQQYYNAFDYLGVGVKQFWHLLERTGEAIKPVVSGMAQLTGMGLKGAFSAMLAPLKSATKGFGGLAKSIGGVLGGFKRIVGYRIIRSIIKEITQGFSEGIKNLYGWSSLFTGAMYQVSGVGKSFKEVMDGIATSTMYLKNSVGAAAAPFISALAPAIDFVIDKAVALLNVINQLMALFSGATSWNRAIKKTQEYGDAVGGAGSAAKEALKYLAPFDELNRLPDDKNGGGGGGSGTDYSGMFEETTEFVEGLKDFTDALKDKINQGDWQGVGQLLGGKINEIVNYLEDNNFFASAGAKIGTGINAWFTTKYWTLQTINFSNIGGDIATAFNNMIANIDFEIIGRSITQKFTIIGDLIVSAVNTINWHDVGDSIGDLIRGAFDQLSEWLNGIDWQTFGYNLYHNLLDLVQGLDFASIAQSLMTLLGAAIGAAVGLVGTFVSQVWEDIKGYFEQYMPNGWDSTGTEIIAGIFQGITNALANVGTWIVNNVFQPLLSGIKSAFGIASPASTMNEPGQMIGEGILEGLLQPFKNIATWIDENIVQPIKNALKNFSLKDLIFGNDNDSGSSSSENWFSRIFGDGIQTEVEVTGVKDSIPSDKKTIGDMIADFKDKIDDIPVVKKALDTVAKFTSGADNLPTSDRRLTSTAMFKGSINQLPTSERQLITTALFKGSIDNLPKDERKITSTALFKGSINSLTTDDRKFTSWANFKFMNNNLTEDQRHFNAWATFIAGAWASWLGADDKTLQAEAELTRPHWRNYDTPTMTVYAQLEYQYNNPGYVMGSSAKGGIWGARGKIADIPQYASGGRVHGSLFLAGESGAEVVGHIGGRTEVLNRSQLAATMYSAVRSAMSGVAFNVSAPSMATGSADDGANEEMLYRAFLRALNDSDIDDRPIELDGNVLYHSMVNRNRQNTRLTGVNALA